MTTPAAPTLRATGTGQGSIRVQIDAVTGAASYRLYRSSRATFSDEALLTATPSIRPNWYFDTTVDEAMTHWYRAAALAAPLTIATSSVANPSVITTTTAHGMETGDTVIIVGHAGSTPAIDGTYVATVISPTTFSIPVNVTVGGTGGTATPESDKTSSGARSVAANPFVQEPTSALAYERANR